jgi:hypothetical protein
MSNDIVKIACKLNCHWEGLYPAYRAWVNNELFTERTWIWTDNLIEEIFQIQAVQPCLASLDVISIQALYGPVRVKSNGIILIG